MTDIRWHTEQRRLGDLTEWAKNPRQLSKHDAEHIKKSLDTFGLADPLIINADGQLIGGHQRKHILESSLSADPDTVVDVRVPSRQLTEREAEELGIRLNKAQGSWDWDALANGFEFDDLIDWGFSEKELHGLDFGGDEADEDPGAEIDRAEELREKWGVETGQLWQLGEHRLICGDCTDAATVARVMGGEKADCTVTDPPYGIGVDYGEFQDTPENVKELIAKVMPIIFEHLPAAFTPGIPAMFDYPKPAWIGAWVHPAPVSGCPWGFVGNNPILYYGADPYLKVGKGRRPDSVVMASDRQGETIHPTSKPLKVWEWLVERLTPEKGLTVFDPFSGSGTTLIACERLGRKCRAVEISPAYVAVALERWATMTGGIPQLCNS